MYVCFAYTYVCALYLCLEPEEDMATLELELQTAVGHAVCRFWEPRSSVRATCTLNW